MKNESIGQTDEKRAELVAGIELWILSQSNKFAALHPTVDRDDIAQDARLRAWKKTGQFDESKGFTFLTFVRTTLEFKMHRFCIENRADVRIPVNRGTVCGYVHLDECAKLRGSGAADHITIGDRIADDNAPDPSAAAETALHADMLSEPMKSLHPIERDVLRLRYWGGKQYREIGPLVGKSKTRAEQIKQRAILKLRALLNREEFAG